MINTKLIYCRLRGIFIVGFIAFQQTMVATANNGDSFARLGAPTDVVVVPWIDAQPKIDGKFDEKLWTMQAVDLGGFYEFAGERSERSDWPRAKINTQARIAYNDQGLWLAVTCELPPDASIDANHQGRDNQNIWRDDCIEIYLGFDDQGYRFRKLIINPLGGIADQISNGGIIDPTWNDDQWKVSTLVIDGAWYAEIFIPWSTLDVRGDQVDHLRLGITRFEWEDGKLQGAAWSAGLSNPHFYFGGLVLFGEDNGLETIDRIVQRQNHLNRPRWHSIINDTLVSARPLRLEVKDRLERAAAFMAEVRFMDSTNSLVNESKSLTSNYKLMKTYKKLATDLNEAADTKTLYGLFIESGELLDKTSNHYWQLKIEQLLTNHIN